MHSNKFILTTKTLVVNTGIIFNLDVIFNFFNCDEMICSIKYKNLLKTKESVKQEKVSFFNQITFKFSKSGTNMKIFKNSKIQITGIKSQDEAKEKLEYLLSKIKDIKGCSDVALDYKNNIVYDKEGNMFSKYEYKIIGKVINENTYFIGKNEECVIDSETGFLISKDFKKCVKNIYFYDGLLIGYKKIIFKNKKYYLKRGSSINENNEIIKYGEVVGCIKTEFVYPEDCIEKMKYKWNNTVVTNKLPYNSYNGDIQNIDFVYETKMTNYIYNIDCLVDRQDIYKVLSDKNYNVYFDPWMYKGINLKLFFKEGEDITNISGACFCIKKCTCSKVSLLIFRTGKIIISSGLKNEDKYLHIIEDFLNKYVKTNKEVPQE